MNRISDGIDAVFLDVGGVFHLPNHGMVLDALRQAGFETDAERLDRAHFVGVAALAAWPDTEGGIWTAYQRAYATEVGVDDERLDEAVTCLDAVFAAPGMWSRVVPGSVEALRVLHATGVPLAIVSNSDGTVESRLRAAGICQVGDGPGVPVSIVVDSAAVGVAKPDPRIFRFALDATGAAPERTLHVGDTVGADVQGALAAGLRPLHLDPHGLCSDHAHEHVAALSEVAELLGR